MSSKHADTDSANCRVCDSEFFNDSKSGSCAHLCFPCEVTLVQCPVCIINANKRTNVNESIISKEELNQAINSILISEQQRANEMTMANAKNPPTKKTLKAEVLKHCFLGVWDGTLNFALKAVGIKSSKKNPVLGTVHNTIARIGRQTGRTLVPDVCNTLSKTTSMKLLGGLAAMLICAQILISRKHSFLK